MYSTGMAVWLRSFLAHLASLLAAAGGVGMFVVAFLDSVAVPLSSASDLLLIELSVKNHLLMPYYALMTTIGSVAGCMLLYYIARKGGEAYFHKHGGTRVERLHRWVTKNGFLAMLIGGLPVLTIQRARTSHKRRNKLAHSSVAWPLMLAKLFSLIC